MTRVTRGKPVATNENATLPATKPAKKRFPLSTLSVNVKTPDPKTNKQNIKHITTTTTKPTATAKKRIPSTATSQFISFSKVNSPHLSPLTANKDQSFGFLDGLEPASSIQRKGFLGGFSFDFGREGDGEEGDDELAIGSCAGGDKAVVSEEEEDDDPYGFCKADREYKRWIYLQPPKTAQVPSLTAESPLATVLSANIAISTTTRDNVIIACPDTPKKRESSPSISISTDSSPLAPGQKKQYGNYLAPKLETKKLAKKGTTGTRKRKTVKGNEGNKEDIVIGAVSMEEEAVVKKTRTKKESTALLVPARRSTRTTSTAGKKKLVVYEDHTDSDE
ncbi:UNVERIFIED_CONTAM: hypothetical protein HDU68_003724 [Siphonaria sp. JEL0065]|nr:hypothetical protein HDU68_003724 [Siphonaria sp. JEL0065]